VIAQTTFYRVAGLKSLANHWLRLYHTHKVWYGGVDEGLIEYGKTYKWLTILLVSLLWCIKVDTLGIPYEEDLDWTHYYFTYLYITNKLHFNILISF